MRHPILTLVLVLGLCGSSLAATEDPLPAPVVTGLQALQDGRCKDAIQLWTSQWPGEGDDIKRQQMLSSCDVLARVGGTLNGYDLVKSTHVTPHLIHAYFLLRYEKQSLYLAISAYAPTDGQWRVEGVNWNTDADKVFPSSVVEPFRPPQ